MFSHIALMHGCVLAQPCMKVCVCLSVTMCKGKQLLLHYSKQLNPRQHRDAEKALVFFSFAVIASAIIFDQGRAEEESPES